MDDASDGPSASCIATCRETTAPVGGAVEGGGVPVLSWPARVGRCLLCDVMTRVNTLVSAASWAWRRSLSREALR